jgi:hypothetical protein
VSINHPTQPNASKLNPNPEKKFKKKKSDSKINSIRVLGGGEIVAMATRVRCGAVRAGKVLSSDV